jgi:photosystem II stability/assembly factor-like uncharacterized protein
VLALLVTWGFPAGAADLYAVAGRSGTSVVAGTGGRIMYSVTSLVWQPSEVTDGEVTEDLYGASTNGLSTTFFIVGQEGTILKSSAGSQGASFIHEISNVSDDLYGVTPFGTAMVAVGANGTILRSSGFLGGSWSEQVSPTSAVLRSAALGPLFGVAVGHGGTTIKGNTGGAGWILGDPDVPNVNLYGVAKMADNRFLAVGAAGTIIRTTDGLDWEEMGSPTTADLYGVAAREGGTPQNIVVAVGEGGVIYYTTAYGDSWDQADSPVTQTLRAVTFTGSEFLACGDNETLIRSVNGQVWNDYTAAEKPSWGNIKGMFRR